MRSLPPDQLYRFDPEVVEEEVAAWAPHLAAAGYRSTDGEDWTLYFARALPPDEVYARLRPGLRVNRQPAIAALALKDGLLANVRSARWWSDDDELFGFHPETFLVPEESARLREAGRRDPGAVWILKRRAATRGRGMRLLRDLESLPSEGQWLVQRYIDRPHLLDGHKYNLRFYLAITSLEPLICHVHERGTCRFASRPYSLAPGSFEDPVVHLTNTEVQTLNRDSAWWERDTDLCGYRRRLADQGLDPEPLFDRIRTFLAGMVIACRDQMLIEGRQATSHLGGCYDFLGVDVQIDHEMRPWILEANAGPPMELEPYGDAEAAQLSQEIKNALIGDLLSLLDGEPRGWRPLWPGPDADRFVRGFPLLRPADRECAAVVCPALRSQPPTIRPAPDVTTLELGGLLALYEPSRGRLHTLNATGSLVWLGLEHLDPGSLTENLANRYPEASRRRIESDLWDLLVGWAQAGLLAGHEPPSHQQRFGPLILPAVRLPDELVIAIDSASLRRWGNVEPTLLPVLETQRLTLVFPSGDDALAEPRSCTPAAALEALGRGLDGSGLERSVAIRCVAWLDSLESIQVGGAGTGPTILTPS